ncbi:MAG: transcriptional regulator, partial [Rhizobiales bacterium]|nr:transcriptional regulator [Hyphomicrobiales bacterium]
RWDLWLAQNNIDPDELHYPSQFDRSSMSIELAKQGGGIALDSVTLCLPQIKSGELVPLSNSFSVIDFPAYWFVCPPRHYNRRIVKLFSEWLAKNSKEHELEARELLNSLGCTFRPETGPDLMSESVDDKQGV